FIFYIDDHRLIVVNQWVRLPLAVDPGDLGRVSFLERCGSRDLPGDKRMIADQHRRCPLFDDLDALGLQIMPAWRNMLGFMPVWKDVLSFEEGIRMQDDRYSWPAVASYQPDKTTRVVCVAVAEHDGMHLVGFDLQDIQIVQHPINGDAGIEKESVLVS